MIPFVEFPKIPRLSRRVVVSEKIDGTNAQIFITKYSAGYQYPEGCIDAWADSDGNLYAMYAGSRTRWITPSNDNYGFAAWVQANSVALRSLGEGHHFGEWWGQGIQRKYGLKEKRFSLFNTVRWCLHNEEPKIIESANPLVVKYQERLPECCHLVPVLYDGEFDTAFINGALTLLGANGSYAAPGFMNPEGIVAYHVAGNFGFKKTLQDDGQPKSQCANPSR